MKTKHKIDNYRDFIISIRNYSVNTNTTPIQIDLKQRIRPFVLKTDQWSLAIDHKYTKEKNIICFKIKRDCYYMPQTV